MTTNILVFIAGLFGTLAIYFINKIIYIKSGKKLYLQPIILCPVILSSILLGFHISYESYMEGAGMVSYMLSPATVAFAVPLYRYREVIRKEGLKLVAIITLACMVAIASSVGFAKLADLGRILEMSLAPRSITTPLAIAAANTLGGNPTITAILVIITGIVGMLIGSIIINKKKINCNVLRGMILGVAAHGTGTAKAYEYGDETGVIASLSMIIMGVVTSLVVPLLLFFL